MNFIALENCLRILKSYISPEESIINEMLSPDQDLDANFLEPFRREIKYNVLERESITSKRDLLKFYIYEHSQIGGLINNNYRLLIDRDYQGSGGTWSDSSDENDIKQATRQECYLLTIYTLYEESFYIIDECCERFGFDFLELCKESNISNFIYKVISDIGKRSKFHFLEKYLSDKLGQIGVQDDFYLKSTSLLLGVPLGDKSEFVNEELKSKAPYLELSRSKFVNYFMEYNKSIQEGNYVSAQKSKIETEESLKNSEMFRKVLKANGFYDLPLVEVLSDKIKESLFNELEANDLPYKVAMLYHLGFVSHLEEECRTKKELYELIAGILESTSRTVKGNLLVLNDYSKEDRIRYTAHLYKETVRKDYKNKKRGVLP